jgi:hypothetical protein
MTTHREAARMTGRASPTADGACPDCGRRVPAADERNGAACGCDWTAPCQMHAAQPARPYYHRACARRTLRRRLERTAAR